MYEYQITLISLIFAASKGGSKDNWKPYFPVLRSCDISQKLVVPFLIVKHTKEKNWERTDATS